MGADMNEAVDSLLAIGPGAELIRLNGEHGEPAAARSPSPGPPLRRLAEPDGSVVSRAAIWIVTATNPG